jgi:hypothetical protein
MRPTEGIDIAKGEKQTSLGANQWGKVTPERVGSNI